MGRHRQGCHDHAQSAGAEKPAHVRFHAELRDTFRALAHDATVKAVVITGAGRNFCSGGDVFEIIEPLTRMAMPELLAFTRLTGDVVKAMRLCPQPVIAAVEGVCAGAGAILAMAADLRYGTTDTSVAFLFTRVGLAGCDMGACAILPRIIGQGRAAELLYTGRVMTGEQAERWDFQCAASAGPGDQRGAGDGNAACGWSDVRAWRDKGYAAPGMEHGHRFAIDAEVRRRRSAWPQAISAVRSRPLPPNANPNSRATEMNTHRILQPAGWPRPRGYSNGIIAAGRTIFLAGQVGWDAEGHFAEGLAAQPVRHWRISSRCSRRPSRTRRI